MRAELAGDAWAAAAMTAAAAADGSAVREAAWPIETKYYTTTLRLGAVPHAPVQPHVSEHHWRSADAVVLVVDSRQVGYRGPRHVGHVGVA